MGCCPKGVYAPLVRDCAGNTISLPSDGILKPSIITEIITVTSSLTAGPNNTIILVDATSGPVTITLPPAISGGDFVIKKIDSTINAVTVDGDGSETIDNSTTQVITVQYVSIRIIADSSNNWWII